MSKKPVSITKYETSQSFQDGVSIKTVKKYDQTPVGGFSILRLIFIVILAIVCFQFVLGIPQDKQLTFSGFLRALSDIPKNVLIKTDWIVKFSDEGIQGNWVIDAKLFSISFEWLRSFLNNYVVDPLSVVLYFVTGIAQAISFIVYFIGIFFGIH